VEAGLLAARVPLPGVPVGGGGDVVGERLVQLTGSLGVVVLPGGEGSRTPVSEVPVEGVEPGVEPEVPYPDPPPPPPAGGN
jgi:hypothetical protein